MSVLRYSWVVESIALEAHAYRFEGNLDQLFGRRARDPAYGPAEYGGADTEALSGAYAGLSTPTVGETQDTRR
jgi:hypothetical protein